jgi:hypothetical protein
LAEKIRKFPFSPNSPGVNLSGPGEASTAFRRSSGKREKDRRKPFRFSAEALDLTIPDPQLES